MAVIIDSASALFGSITKILAIGWRAPNRRCDVRSSLIVAWTPCCLSSATIIGACHIGNHAASHARLGSGARGRCFPKIQWSSPTP